MGLDFTFRGCSWPWEEKPHWSYSGFMRFRTRLAAQIGVCLKDMRGFDGHLPWEDVKDAVVPLLNHSDCDGHLAPSVCKRVAPRLRKLVSEWPTGDLLQDERVYDREQAMRLAKMMDQCARRKVQLRFV